MKTEICMSVFTGNHTCPSKEPTSFSYAKTDLQLLKRLSLNNPPLTWKWWKTFSQPNVGYDQTRILGTYHTMFHHSATQASWMIINSDYESTSLFSLNLLWSFGYTWRELQLRNTFAVDEIPHNLIHTHSMCLWATGISKYFRPSPYKKFYE